MQTPDMRRRLKADWKPVTGPELVQHGKRLALFQPSVQCLRQYLHLRARAHLHRAASVLGLQEEITIKRLRIKTSTEYQTELCTSKACMNLTAQPSNMDCTYNSGPTESLWSRNHPIPRDAAVQRVACLSVARLG